MEPTSTETGGGGKTWYDKFGTPIALVLGLGLIAAAIFYGGDGAPQNAGGNNGNGTPRGEGAPVSIEDVKTENSPSVGSLAAPVVIAHWFDYQCPFCKRFDEVAMGKLYETYVKTGQVRIIFKDFQFLSEDSMTAARYGRAIYEAYPDKFFAYYQLMMENQDEEHGGFGDEASILAALKASSLGIDTDRVKNMVASNQARYDAAIEADRDEGATLGVSGTPSTLIGAALLPGAQPYETVEAALKQVLK